MSDRAYAYVAFCRHGHAFAAVVDGRDLYREIGSIEMEARAIDGHVERLPVEWVREHGVALCGVCHAR